MSGDKRHELEAKRGLMVTSGDENHGLETLLAKKLETLNQMEVSLKRIQQLLVFIEVLSEEQQHESCRRN